jgi:anti-sigma B factor antagonist
MSASQGFAVEVSDPDDGTVRIAARGELDMAAAPDLAEAIAKASGSGATTILLDLSAVMFLDSSAIGSLVASGREVSESGGRLQIGPRSDIVTRVLEITGLSDSSGAFDVLAEDG